jgi:hypothetical protein
VAILDFDKLSSADLEHLAALKREDERREEDARVTGLIAPGRGETWGVEDRRLTEQADPATNEAFERPPSQPMTATVEIEVTPCDAPSASRGPTGRVPPALGAFPRVERPYRGWPLPIPHRRWTPAGLVTFAVDISDGQVEMDGALTPDDARVWLSQIAAREGLSPDALSDALIALGDRR